MNHQVVAPVPGIFYRRPSPEEALFVDVGSVVAPDTIVGLVEVMKTFYEIFAEEAGHVITVEATDSAMVSAGQVLMTITTATADDHGAAS